MSCAGRNLAEPLLSLGPCPSVDEWAEHFVPAKYADWDPRHHEGLWRRTQDPCNAGSSGWRGSHDARRRMVHFDYTFDLMRLGLRDELVLKSCYVWVTVALPALEVAAYEATLRDGVARHGGWRQNAQGIEGTLSYTLDNGLSLVWRRFQDQPADASAGREFPEGYEHLEVMLHSSGRSAEELRELRGKPWYVLASGFRKIPVAHTPVIDDDLAQLKHHLPMHVELGCGPSIEAGIPPLHDLHRIYAVSNAHRRFVFTAEEDELVQRLAGEPMAFLREASNSWLRCVHASPTPFYHVLRKLRDAGLIIGPIFTNNFDRLCNRVGLQEQYIRRFDEIVPPVDFHPEARSLLVVGSHADRRQIQRRAREAGLKVFFVDPECFVDNAGNRIRYSLEAPQEGDYHCRRAAGDALGALESVLMQAGAEL